MKSLELNWIKKYDKSLVIPEVVFSSISWASGLYYKPNKKELYIDGRHYDLHFGLIEISKIHNETFKDIASTLAHEWRHHWQTYNKNEMECYFKWPRTYDDSKYDLMILEYFTLNPPEMDALRFQKKYASIEEKWEQILYNYVN